MRYPNNIRKEKTTNCTSRSNRGLSLESDLNITNEYYRDKEIAIVYKKPTPIKCVDVKTVNKKTIITKAFYEMPSTTDYNGIYKERYIDFEAKEVKSNNSFVLSNIHKHQLKHLFSVLKQGGISFIIVRFCKVDETYILMSSKLKEMVEENKKSITIEEFKTYGCLVKNNYNPRLDYITAIDKLYFGGQK